MAVRIRLRRIGKKKQPQYRLVVADSRSPRDGRFIETIGQYNPRVDPPEVRVKEDRALYWLSQGAQPSDTARSLLVRVGVLQKTADQEGSAPAAGGEQQESPTSGPAEEE